MNENAGEIAPEDLVIVHVGAAEGGLGVADGIIRMHPKRSVVYGFEARSGIDWDAPEQAVLKGHVEAGARLRLVHGCITEKGGLAWFYVNKHVESSSLLPPDPDATQEHMGIHVAGSGVARWGEETELDHMELLDTLSLGDFLGREHIPHLDVLSLDVQGAELSILRGVGPLLDTTGAVITECEFSPVYQGQALFHEQAVFLMAHGFRLADITSVQLWHPGPAMGKGLLTVGEALWLRDVDAHYTGLIERCVRTAMVAIALERYSYAFVLLLQGLEMNAVRCKEICALYPDAQALKLVQFVLDHREDYAKDPTWLHKRVEVRWRNF